MERSPAVQSVSRWIEENENGFKPPVCNKSMCKGQMKLFFAGGPNQRKDYHLEEGEELFYMLKGDMCVKVIDKGSHRDIHIREGEAFLLPPNTFHSPQRSANTVGFVIERRRSEEEFDGLVYFVERDGHPTADKLYERYFHCDDLDTELNPIIREFFESKQFATGEPDPNELCQDPPVLPKPTELERNSPVHLRNWIEENKCELKEIGRKVVFQGDQILLEILAEGEDTYFEEDADTWLWMLNGTATATDPRGTYSLVRDDCILIPEGNKFTIKRNEDALVFKCHQNERKKASQAPSTNTCSSN